MDAPIAEQIPRTADNGRMGEFVAEIFFAQISMCIEVNDGEIGISLRRSSDCGEADQMLPADQKGQLSAVQDRPCALPDHRQCSFGIAKGQLQIPPVKDACILEIEFLIRAVRLQSV